MIDVVSIKFKNRGKCYFFSPNGLTVNSGDKVVVETSKGLELADCCRGNHGVADTVVVQPLRPVVRIATADDLRVAEVNKQREKEAFDICQQKIGEHGLDMKLVDVECNFEGNKTMFFFTSEGRVDFRELVKDLAGVFRNRIELRQIGVRDEAKMIGGIGICGRPYCCSQFLEDFQPVSTKMAKVQSLSLNPTKISGSCGRLMCCLRYEQDAYEELIKKVPKQGSFVETKDGYGMAVQVNLLRQNVKVRLDSDNDDSLRTYKANELVAVPGGRPKDGAAPVSTLNYVPEEEIVEDEPEKEWVTTIVVEPESFDNLISEEKAPDKKPGGANRRRRGRGKGNGGSQSVSDGPQNGKPAAPRPARTNDDKSRQGSEKRSSGFKQTDRATVKPVRIDKPPQQDRKTAPFDRKPAPTDKKQGAENAASRDETAVKKNNNRRRKYYNNNKPKGNPQG